MVLPLNFGELIIFLNSKWRIVIILIQNILIREGIIQYIGGITIKPIKILIQFNDKNRFVDGSKDENKFAIIFNYCVFF